MRTKLMAVVLLALVGCDQGEPKPKTRVVAGQTVEVRWPGEWTQWTAPDTNGVQWRENLWTGKIESSTTEVLK